MTMRTLKPAVALVSLMVAVICGGALLAAQAAPPKVGDKAPDFTLAQIDGRKLTLSTELGAGPVVLIVGRGWVGRATAADVLTELKKIGR
jgi:hypothetical protein